MSTKSNKSLRPEQLLAAFSSVGCLVAVILLAYVCLVAGLSGMFLVNAVEEAEPTITLLEKRVPVDPANLPEDLVIHEWYATAMTALDETGWTLPLDLLSFTAGLPCTSLSDVSLVTMEFAAIESSPVLPHEMVAVVSFDREKGDASVWIYDAGPQLPQAGIPIMRLTSLQVELLEALDTAERLGGREFRARSNDECDVVIWLRDYEWNLDYRNPLSTRSGLRITVDAITGRTTRLDR